MKSVIEQVLFEIAVCPRLELAVEADRFLMRIKHTDHHDAFDALMNRHDDLSRDEIIAAAEKLIKETLDDILSDHGILYEDDTPLHVLYHAADMLYRLPDIDETTYIQALIDDGSDPVDVYTGILSWMTNTDEMLSGEHLDVVQSTFVDLVEKMLDERPSDDESIEHATPSRVVKYIEKGVSPHVVDAIESGMQLGMGVSYYKEVAKWIAEAVKTPMEAAYEVLGLCLASDLPDQDIVKSTMRIVEYFFPDHVNEFSKITGVLDAIMLELHQS